MGGEQGMERRPGAEHARQEPLGPDAVDHRIDREAIDQDLGKGRAECRVPRRAIDWHAGARGEPAGVAVDEIDDPRALDGERRDEAEKLRQIAHRCADGRKLPVVRAQLPAAFDGAQADVAWVEVVVDQRLRPALDAAPQTLIHNDFNPRNVCLRSVEGGWQVCAYDWELAAIGTPMRDLAEFLCFVSPLDVGRARIVDLIDRHAGRFAAGAGVPVDRAAWHAAFGAALAEILIDRLSVYAMVHRVRPQRFLPRVLRTWSALHSLFPAHGVAG